MKKLLFLSILMLLPMLASAQTVSDVQNSGCLNKTRGDESQSVPTIVLTKEGNILSVQLLNYEENCCAEDFNVTSSINSNSDSGSYWVSINIDAGGWECDCTCPFNVSFTVRDLEPNSFYLDCWWYEGLVELTEGEPLVLEHNDSGTQEYFPEGTKWTEIRLDTLKYDSWYSKVGDEWVPNFETIEYYVKGKYSDGYGGIYNCVYTNGPEWTDSLMLLIPCRGDFLEPNSVMVSVLSYEPEGVYAFWPAEVYQFDWNVGKGIYYENILMANTTSAVRSQGYYGIIHEIKEGYFGGVRPLKYVDLDGKAPENKPNSNIKNGNTKGGRIIQGIGVTEWNDGECLFGPPDPYDALDGEYHGRHYRSMLVHFERNGEVLYDVWPEKLPQIEINEQNFPDELFRKWVLNQEYGKDGILTEKEIAGVTFMNLFPQNLIPVGHIKSLKGIEYFTAVTKIVCSRNELTELDLSKNTALTWLECYGNHLTELDLSKNTELTNLDCNSNELTGLDMSYCNKLTELNCSMNELTTLNVSGCSALTFLKCYANQLTVIDVSGCTSLVTMWAFENHLSALNVFDCVSLSTLRCEYNQLTQLDVSKNTELTELRCHENQLTTLDLSKNKKLESLWTFHNPIKGEAMDALIESLPKVSRGGWCCVRNKDEEGSPTTTQVAAAKKKGWTSYCWDETNKSWMEYSGTETPQMAYRPMIEEGKVWKVGALNSGNPVQLVDYYYFDGDTIINGKICKQMMRQQYINPDYPEYDAVISQRPSLHYVGAWYEEDKQVYIYDTTNKQFKIMYDFSIEDNDTLQIDDYIVYLYVVGPRQTGGIRGFKGVYRDVRRCEGENSSYSPTWLEGVGSIKSPTKNVYYEDQVPTWILMSCTVGDEVIYLNDEYEDGATPMDAEAKKHRFDFTHTIKTKPQTRGEEEEQSLYGEYNNLLLGINLEPLDEAYLVRITNESDQVVYEKTINAGSIVGLNIDISAFAKGRYTVTIENSSEVFTGEFETLTTGIQELKNSRIEELKSIYNLQGQRLNRLQKGLNIVGGRKVFVK